MCVVANQGDTGWTPAITEDGTIPGRHESYFTGREGLCPPPKNPTSVPSPPLFFLQAGTQAGRSAFLWVLLRLLWLCVTLDSEVGVTRPLPLPGWSRLRACPAWETDKELGNPGPADRPPFLPLPLPQFSPSYCQAGPVGGPADAGREAEEPSCLLSPRHLRTKHLPRPRSPELSAHFRM